MCTLPMLSAKSVFAAGLHKLQVLRKAKQSSVTHSALGDELIWNDQWIILGKFCKFKLSVPKGSVNNVVVALRYSKVCTHWFPWSLNDCHKTVWKKMCSDFVFPHEADCEGFLSWIVTGNETCNDHFELQTKQHPVALSIYSLEEA